MEFLHKPRGPRVLADSIRGISAEHAGIIGKSIGHGSTVGVHDDRHVGAIGHAWRMRIFISSITSGLVDERRQLAGLIEALGHEPVMFEKFGARVEPSRQECLEAVQSSDVYLLLLGEHYGHRFPETGQSATHDEFIAARAAGIPCLVFHKTGVQPDSDQGKFIAEVGDYASGHFWADFAGAADLQPLVVKAIRTLESAPSPLTFEPLASPPTVSWKDDWSGALRQGWGHVGTFVELHATPLTESSVSARQMHELPDALVSKLRTYGVLPMAAGAEVDTADGAVTVTLPPQDRHHDQMTESRFGGIRVAATGQVSAWTTLARDSMGAMLDSDDLADAVALQLRVIGALNVVSADRVALSIGLGGAMSLVSFAKPGVRRNSASLGFGSDEPVRIDPDESVSTAAFDVGADEVARLLVRALLAAVRP
jgi:hypothetical protein